MPKFKNKKTGVVVEENLIFYINKLRNNPNFKEIEIKENEIPKNDKNKEKEEVENTPR